MEQTFCQDCQERLWLCGVNAFKECDCKCHEQAKDWDEYVNSLTKEERDETTRLIFNYREFNFKDNKLAISKAKFSNLDHIYANNCGLKSVELNFFTLTNLYLNGNELESIDLIGV